MHISLICVDASVVVRLVASHENTVIQDVWDKWRDEGYRVIAPALLFYEVTNALYRSAKYGTISEMAASEALKAAESLPIQLYADADLHQRALAVAQRYGLPAAYDAHYVALAQSCGAVLWTTDKRLVKRCQQEWVKLLE